VQMRKNDQDIGRGLAYPNHASTASINAIVNSQCKPRRNLNIVINGQGGLHISQAKNQQKRGFKTYPFLYFAHVLPVVFFFSVFFNSLRIWIN
jgi:hypothetical protein